MRLLKLARIEKLRRRGEKGVGVAALAIGARMVDGVGQRSQLVGKETRNEIDRLYVGVRNKFSR